MAERPDVDNPVWGYFVTPVFEEVSAYVHAILEKYNQSCIFILHCSAEFTKDGDVQELHMLPFTPVILDPANEFLDEILDNQHGLCFDNDQYQDFEGSDWILVPGTHRFWFKIYPCQPNPTPHPTEQNVSDQHGHTDDPDDDPTGRSRSPIDLYRNTFFLSLGEFFMRKNNVKPPRMIIMKNRAINDWVQANMPELFTPFDLEEPFTLQDIASYHFEVKRFNIRIFSMYGNVLYAKKFDDDDWIDLYVNSYKEFALVLKLNALFKRGLDRKLCDSCHCWHRTNNSCNLQVFNVQREELPVRKLPKGRHGLVCYSDFESIIDSENRHKTSGWACCSIDKYHYMYEMQWENAVTHPPADQLIPRYLQYLFRLAYSFSVEWEGHETHDCMICEESVLDSPENRVVIGRNFLNGRSGSHHIDCWNMPENAMYVFFHNFRGYDSHFLIREIVTKYMVLGMSATSMEKFNLIRITHIDYPLIQICFKDTYNFFTCSLAKCVSMIENWVYTPENSRDAKGTFPYDWFDNFDKLKENSLPPPPWINKVTNGVINHEPAFREWAEHGFNEFSQYHDFYMTNDTVQLADAFEEFRRTCIDEFNIDPVHFQGAPGYTWYLGHKHNPQLFKVITDKEIYLDIQSQIRGGVSQAMLRYANVEESEDESIFFLDVNSLYSKCMTYKLPGKFIEKLEQLPDNWEELYNRDGRFCALVNVDLVYPEHLHDRDWAYPLAPHKFNDRLCTTFLRRENYLVHSELLEFYLARGLVLEKVNYLYVFEQDYVLRDYVQTNIEKRRHTRSEVMKTLYKLLNNSLYGKTCENVFKYRKFEVYEDQINQGGQANYFLYRTKNVIQYDDMYLCEMQPDVVKLNKPIQIGFTILEFAKREIYRFLSICSNHFGDKVVPLYTDTDSLMFLCKFKEPWLHFYNSPLQPYLDFEKAPSHWNVRTADTDKQSGLWSPEANGKEIVEFCGLRSKTYCYRFRDGEIVIKNKGIPKSAMITNEDDTPRDKITMDHYKDALYLGVEYKVSQYAIRSEKHEVETKQLFKLGLSANDLKRTVTSDRAVTLPFGYRGEKFKHLVTDAEDPDRFQT